MIRTCATLCLVASLPLAQDEPVDPGGAPGADELAEMLARVNELGREIAERVRAARAEGGNALAELEVLRGLEDEYRSEGPMAQQVLALYLMERTVELGNYEEALRYAELQGPPRSWEPVADDVLAGYAPADGLGAVAELADGERAVFLNEAHHVPQHRVFTQALLPPPPRARLHPLRRRDALRERRRARLTRLSDRRLRRVPRRTRLRRARPHRPRPRLRGRALRGGRRAGSES